MFAEHFANAAYLLWQAPLDAEGADQAIGTFLITVADFLFADRLDLPANVVARARMLPRFDLPTIEGFVSWFAAQLPPVGEMACVARAAAPGALRGVRRPFVDCPKTASACVCSVSNDGRTVTVCAPATRHPPAV